MQIDLKHLHHWMQAIRQSPDPIRTMDAFWQGQLNSKVWLINELRKHVDRFVTVDIHGGWVGVLASLMFQSNLPIKSIRSIDIDPQCEPLAKEMNRLEETSGRFTAVTADMCDIISDADVVVNTSCEHITQEQYDRWLDGLKSTSILVLQSNNFPIPEHVRIVESLQEFIDQSNVEVLWSGEMQLHLYTRYMIIGKKRV